jgi:hypothetical protein
METCKNCKDYLVYLRGKCPKDCRYTEVWNMYTKGKKLANLILKQFEDKNGK